MTTNSRKVMRSKGSYKQHKERVLTAIPKMEFRDDTIRNKNTNKVGRNEPCPCKSGKKFKKCCLI